mgnify:CR=1 FL=1|tara:strand:+ start:1018 stop:1227 length:210 start_codon:yes stop_codon:yes gene_type:complete
MGKKNIHRRRKKFNGEWYVYAGDSRLKRMAVKRRTSLKNSGYKVRIIKYKSSMSVGGSKFGYDIYKRKK